MDLTPNLFMYFKCRDKYEANKLLLITFRVSHCHKIHVKPVLFILDLMFTNIIRENDPQDLNLVD